MPALEQQLGSEPAKQLVIAGRLVEAGIAEGARVGREPLERLDQAAIARKETPA